MLKPLRLVRFLALPFFALPITLGAQAAVEYAMKSAGSAVSASGSAAIAGCKVDSVLLTCLSHSYPRTMIFAAVVICVIIMRWLFGLMGHRAR